jgi:hypothetical protein
MNDVKTQKTKNNTKDRYAIKSGRDRYFFPNENNAINCWALAFGLVVFRSLDSAKICLFDTNKNLSSRFVYKQYIFRLHEKYDTDDFKHHSFDSWKNTQLPDNVFFE